MIDAERAAAESMRDALGLMPCACVFDYPYHPRGKRVTQCSPCRAIEQWDLTNKNTKKPGEN